MGFNISKTFLVRHGQSEFNVGLTRVFNSSMTKHGFVQAARAGLFLKDEIGRDCEGFTSPYTRCLQTSRIIHQITGIKFKIMPEIGETPEEIHRSQVTIVPRDEASYPEFDWSHVAKDGYDYTKESVQEYLDRLNSFLKSLPENNVLICSHMTPTTHMINALCGMPVNEITITNCSVSLIENKKPVYIGKTP